MCAESMSVNSHCLVASLIEQSLPIRSRSMMERSAAETGSLASGVMAHVEWRIATGGEGVEPGAKTMRNESGVGWMGINPPLPHRGKDGIRLRHRVTSSVERLPSCRGTLRADRILRS